LSILFNRNIAVENVISEQYGSRSKGGFFSFKSQHLLGFDTLLRKNNRSLSF